MTESNELPLNRSDPRWEESSRSQIWAEHVTTTLERSPVRIRELVALFLLVVLADLTIYRSQGFAGPSVLFFIAPFLIGLGVQRLFVDRSVGCVAPMLILASIRLVWCGSYLAVFAGSVLFVFIAMGLVGAKPYVLPAISYVMFLIAAAFRGLSRYVSVFSRFRFVFSAAQWFAVIAPLAAVIGFATIFIKANPDLSKSVAQAFSDFFENIQWWTRNLQFGEFVFCLAAGFVATGILNPWIQDWFVHDRSDGPSRADTAPRFAGYRNTLIAVIVLFAVYLIFEFQSLWFRSFPKGFHYSGYAHEGAAWLTVALALATVILSVIFHGNIHQHPRFAHLKTLSWIWSVENLLLAIAVFNRLSIYVRFNGMTQMRVVGMLGVASVIGGFLLVLVKIARNHNFAWLIRRQLWTVMFAIDLYAVLPVDAFVNQYNVSRIMVGDVAPSVQIAFHPTSDEGLLFLSPLMECSDEAIRDGVRSMLGTKLSELTIHSSDYVPPDWTQTQIARTQLVRQLRSLPPELFASKAGQRETAMQKFREYTYQWY